MNDNRTELSFLKEFVRLIDAPEKRAAKFKKISLSIGLISIAGLFVTGHLLSNKTLSDSEAMFLSALFGISIGVGMLYRISAMQIPYFIKYFDPKTAELRARIGELQK